MSLETSVPVIIPGNERFLRFIVDTKYSIYRRTLFVLILFITMLGGNKTHEFTDQTFYVLKAAGFFFTLLLISLNLYVLIPVYLFKGRYLHYVFWVFVVIVCSFILYTILKAQLPELRIKPVKQDDDGYMADFLSLSMILCILCAATSGLKLFQRWIKDNYRIVQLENIRMHTEMDFLKNQINPHFLFNMLNNSQVLIQTDPDRASEILIKLSDLLRYQLYDSGRQQVLLSADIRFLIHFLSLEKIRRDYFEFQVQQEGTEQAVLLPPLLFIPFVENAVKHNIQSVEGAFVQLSFKLIGRSLIFECRNPKPLSGHTLAEKGGLGLPNVKRRLELLYPGKYQLQLKEEPALYTVHLKLSL
ncbi:sensor histidine kinase [Pedobacter sp. MC2016-24]|uniref:sensor histidine kinase n=1 Tax=Pedobacter sp. MC2016-24 TaxID=2780090 RepID=UPI0018824D99|nr:histidine kinase [Pedobacter sp. MC2016-24]MBE9600007.1 histidine kinase [Pedobacter sp. MC2016-24]